MENIDIDKLTPMMKIYCETKEQYKDCILFYRLGDFYEMFFDDALTASRPQLFPVSVISSSRDAVKASSKNIS